MLATNCYLAGPNFLLLLLKFYRTTWRTITKCGGYILSWWIFGGHGGTMLAKLRQSLTNSAMSKKDWIRDEWAPFGHVAQRLPHGAAAMRLGMLLTILSSLATLCGLSVMGSRTACWILPQMIPSNWANSTPLEFWASITSVTRLPWFPKLASGKMRWCSLTFRRRNYCQTCTLRGMQSSQRMGQSFGTFHWSICSGSWPTQCSGWRYLCCWRGSCFGLWRWRSKHRDYWLWG